MFWNPLLIGSMKDAYHRSQIPVCCTWPVYYVFKNIPYNPPHICKYFFQPTPPHSSLNLPHLSPLMLLIILSLRRPKRRCILAPPSILPSFYSLTLFVFHYVTGIPHHPKAPSGSPVVSIAAAGHSSRVGRFPFS